MSPRGTICPDLRFPISRGNLEVTFDPQDTWDFAARAACWALYFMKINHLGVGTLNRPMESMLSEGLLPPELAEPGQSE
jgi:hypothetical protein